MVTGPRHLGLIPGKVSTPHIPLAPHRCRLSRLIKGVRCADDLPGRATLYLLGHSCSPRTGPRSFTLLRTPEYETAYTYSVHVGAPRTPSNEDKRCLSISSFKLHSHCFSVHTCTPRRCVLAIAHTLMFRTLPGSSCAAFACSAHHVWLCMR